MTGPTIPPVKGDAQLNITDWSKGIRTIQTDLRAVQELAKRSGTLRITADLSATRDIQKVTRALRDSLQEVVPSDMQRRIDSMFGQFTVGANAAKQSAGAFEAQASALRARIDQLNRAVRITRADFQAGFGDASPEEIGRLTSEMNRLSRELEEVGATAKQEFGEYSREAEKVAIANRLAQTTAAAARGEISRLGLASQVKLGVGSALQQYGGQAGFAATNLFGFARASDSARIASGLFDKTVTKTGQSSEAAAGAVANLQDTLGVTGDAAREGIRGLLRQGFTLEQANKALVGAGASALAAGKSAQDGMSAFVDAVTSGTSARLNEIGVSENLSTFLQKEAKARGTTVDALDKQGRAAAALALITAATNDEVGDLGELMGGVTGNVNSATRELDEATKKLGQVLIPIATNGIRVLTGFLDVFNRIPEAGQNAIVILGASAVALGVLAGPVTSLTQGFAAVRNGLAGARGATDALAGSTQGAAAAAGNLGESVGGAAQSTLALTDLAQRADGYYAALNARLTTSVTAHLAAGGSANVMSRAFLSAVGSTVLLNTSLGALTITAALALAGVAAVAAGVGLYANKLINDVQSTYDQIDAANNKSFETTMARVAALTKEGTELSKAKAKVLIAQQQLAAAEQGDLVRVTPFGERIYKPNEEAVKRYSQAVIDARQNVVLLFTEAQRRGELNAALTEQQTAAVNELKAALGGREFDLRVGGMTQLQGDLERLKKTFDDLKIKFKEPFTVNGKLLDPAQTPALRNGLAQLDAQLAAERTAIIKKAADQAAATARESALSAQRAEVDAMVEGQAKKAALRQLEIDGINRDAEEKAKALADFPKESARVEADARAVIAARRRQWAREDRQQAVENARRIVDAEQAAQAAVINAMEDGLAKREAVRAQDLANLRATIAERVAALAGDPEAQAGVQAAGQTELAAREREQQRERVKEFKDAQSEVNEARRAARDAEIASIQNETAQRRAAREQEVADFRAGVQRRLDALRDYPALQAQVLAAARAQSVAMEQRYAVEDQQDARQRAQRIVDLWRRAQEAQAQAISAGLDVASARYELQLSRQLAAAEGNAERVAQIELRAVQERATIEDRLVQDSLTRQRRALTDARDKQLADEKLSAGERVAVIAAYEAGVANLERNAEAERLKRLRQRQADEREALEDIRKARVAAAFEPAERIQRTADRLSEDAQFSTSDAETLRINTRLNDLRQEQIALYQGLLARAKELKLTEEERQNAEDRIRALQNEQKIAQRDQLAAARALTQSVFDRLDAEAAYAERSAQTDAAALAARRDALNAYQARLTTLDAEIAGEDREAERNVLLQRRLDLTGQMLDLQARIDNAPLEQERRRVTLYQAQAELLLQAAGLSDDQLAKAQAAVGVAREEFALARQALSLARTEAAQDEARTLLAERETALLAAQAQVTDARNERDAETLDLAEARLRAEARITGMAEDAVAAAELDLELTQQRLAATRQALSGSGLSGARRADLAREELDLTAQQAEQERKLAGAQRDRRTLIDGLATSQQALARAMAGGSDEEQRSVQAQADLLATRRALIAAEREYIAARDSGNLARQKTATDDLTTAIKAQRDAVKALSDGYEKALTSMDGVRDAAARLSGVLNPEEEGKKKPINGNTEIDRMIAIQKRRDAAADTLENALRSGIAEDIRVATDEFTKQQERYQKQVDLLRKNGIQVSESGRLRAEQLGNEVDALGIQYDRESLLIDARQRAADREAEAAQVFSTAVDAFSTSLTNFKPPVREDPTAYLFQGERFGSLAERDAFIRSRTSPDRTALPDLTELLSLLRAQQVRAALPAPAAVPAALPPTPAPAVNHITNWDVDVTVNGAGLNPDQVANQVITKLEDRARRSGRNC
ncbi:hypothetical protein IHN63_01940 [Deinococcus sp. 6YEL10]|uniref:hypothetical protein n=1 Tax=Deinococcus sp. 6YEL10 TaxID=2745870 RepID=UPI001E3CAB35|nr:hypothetical protein [Deinococcus sp. 6YEL10]MCD0160060.1 hypothetical protein [Deinococcus sp. 6YEL10]